MKDNLSGQSGLDGVHHGIAVLTAHHDHFAGGDSGHLGGGSDLILILEVVLHRLLLVLDIGIHCVHDLLRLALSRLDDGNAVALHHHGREGGGKIGVAALGQIQQGEQHVLDLIVQVIRRIAGAVAVLGDELAVLCRERGVLFHTDAVQAAGHLAIDVQATNIDLLSLSGHKFHGPKGAGALYTRRGIALQNVLYGGGQERGHRAGTENVPAIAGLAAALAQADANLPANTARCLDLRQRLTKRLLAIPGTHLNGDAAQRLPGNVNITFDGVEAETLLLLLDEAGICASAGSACSAGAVEPSHVLLALGLTPAQAKSTLRLTLDAANTAEEIDTAAAVITACVQRLRDGVR